MTLTKLIKHSAPVAQASHESTGDAPSGSENVLDRKVVIVLITTAITLTLNQYGKSPLALEKAVKLLAKLGFEELASQIIETLVSWHHDQFIHLAWWVAASVTCYVVIPGIVIQFILRESIFDYGIKLRTALTGFPIYMGMLAVVLPIALLMSGEERFQATYPFYRISPHESLDKTFWCWEALYAAQFVALEFFFRGFMVQGVRHRFGVNGVLVMMVPYCMIHFGKPMPETFAAIIAGIALGVMSFRTRSIWMGAVLHVAVAWSMDASVILQQRNGM